MIKYIVFPYTRDNWLKLKSDIDSGIVNNAGSLQTEKDSNEYLVIPPFVIFSGIEMLLFATMEENNVENSQCNSIKVNKKIYSVEEFASLGYNSFNITIE